jgi:FAD/FMN-containing dehydrogenase
MEQRTDTPVALILFRRADTLAPVFAAVRAARPTRLYLIADGPRPDRPGEAEAVAAARAVVERVDWPCAVTRVYADTNMGLRRRVESGLQALFAAEERAIILEDDCVPHASFFAFCAELLERYDASHELMAVTGSCFLRRRPTQASYFFSRYPIGWGWASWRRAWARYDHAMTDWPVLGEPWLRALLGDRQAARFWFDAFERVYADAVDSWAYRWVYSCWRHGGLAAAPALNLVSNVGHGPLATHTSSPDSPLAALPTRALELPLRHPPGLARDVRADAAIQRMLFSTGLRTQLAYRWRRLRRLLSGG